MTIFLFSGQEDFLIQKNIQSLKDKLLDKNFLTMNFKSYSNPSFPDLITVLNTTPMMFGNSINIIEANKYFEASSENAFNDKQLVQIDNALSAISDKVNIIFTYIIERNQTKKIDTRRKFYKTIAKHAHTQDFPQYPTYSKELPSVIKSLGKENNLVLDTKICEKIITTLGSNLRLIDNELKKIQAFIHPQKSPSLNDIDAICSCSQDIFKFIDFFILSQKDKALEEFQNLIQTQHPLQILSLLQNTISRFIELKLLSQNLSPFEISRQLGMHEYRVKLELEKIKKFRYNDLLKLKNKLINTELKIKTGRVFDDNTSFAQFILTGN